MKGRVTRDEGRGVPSQTGDKGRVTRDEGREEPAVYGLPFHDYSFVAENGAVRNFEDLVAWQKARALSKAIYAATRQKPFCQDFGLAGQIQRAAVSVMSNIAEGHERGSANEFHHFLSTAKGSCAEVRCQLYVALDAGYVDESLFEELMSQTREVSRIIGGLRAAGGARRK